MLELNWQGLFCKSNLVSACKQATLIISTIHDQCSLMYEHIRDVFHQLNMTLMAPVVAEFEAI